LWTDSRVEHLRGSAVFSGPAAVVAAVMAVPVAVAEALLQVGTVTLRPRSPSCRWGFFLFLQMLSSPLPPLLHRHRHHHHHHHLLLPLSTALRAHPQRSRPRSDCSLKCYPTIDLATARNRIIDLFGEGTERDKDKDKDKDKEAATVVVAQTTVPLPVAAAAAAAATTTTTTATAAAAVVVVVAAAAAMVTSPPPDPKPA